MKRSISSFLGILCIVTIPAYSQHVPVFTPTLTPTIRKSSEGFNQFLNLWEYSLKTDSSTPTIRGDLDPKTLLLPGDSSMARLVPQDGSHPLFLPGEQFSKLRQEFILDHLVLDSIPVDGSDPDISTTTLSGKQVRIHKDSSGTFYVNGVNVKKVVSLTGGYYILVLEDPLFDQTNKVRDAFDRYHKIKSDDPTGPPLDIPDGPFPSIHPSVPSMGRAPAPPTRRAKPPSPPLNLPKISSPSDEPTRVHPPAPPS